MLLSGSQWNKSPLSRPKRYRFDSLPSTKNHIFSKCHPKTTHSLHPEVSFMHPQHQESSREVERPLPRTMTHFHSSLPPQVPGQILDHAIIRFHARIIWLTSTCRQELRPVPKSGHAPPGRLPTPRPPTIATHHQAFRTRKTVQIRRGRATVTDTKTQAPVTAQAGRPEAITGSEARRRPERPEHDCLASGQAPCTMAPARHPRAGRGALSSFRGVVVPFPITLKKE